MKDGVKAKECHLVSKVQQGEVMLFDWENHSWAPTPLISYLYPIQEETCYCTHLLSSLSKYPINHLTSSRGISENGNRK